METDKYLKSNFAYSKIQTEQSLLPVLIFRHKIDCRRKKGKIMQDFNSYKINETLSHKYYQIPLVLSG